MSGYRFVLRAAKLGIPVAIVNVGPDPRGREGRRPRRRSAGRGAARSWPRGSAAVTREVERTDDGRWLVVDGRRWRAAGPRRCPTTSASGCCTTSASAARGADRRRAGDDAAVAAARARVQLAKTGLGERGPRLVGAVRRRAAGPLGGGAAPTLDG